MNSYTGLIPYSQGIALQADAIATAPIPPAAKKTALRRLYESALAQDTRSVLTSPTAHGVVTTVRGVSAGAGVGLLLGWVAGNRAKGLDTPFGPLDAYAAGAGIIGSLIPGNPVAEDCRNAAIAASAILAYRRMETKKRTETGVAKVDAHGIEDPTDHIVAIAKKLGLNI